MMTYHAQFLLLVVAGWVNRQQQDVIDYLQEENRVLRAGLRGKRVLSKNTNELKIRPKMAPNCLFSPVSHWFPAKTGQLRSACDPQKKKIAYRWIDFLRSTSYRTSSRQA